MITQYINTTMQGDALKMLKLLPDKSVDCCFTSPPYWAKRDYGVKGQLGMEATPEQYVNKLVKILMEVHRVLKPAGTLWLNIGDTYIGGKGANGASIAYAGAGKRINKKALITTSPGKIRPNDRKHKYLKAKDLVGIPWRVAFALQRKGWYLRNDNIWHKGNAMPESINDRCTVAHEYVFLLAKSRKYYYDAKAIKTDLAESTVIRNQQDIDNQTGSSRAIGKENGNMKSIVTEKANKRTVWKINTVGSKEDHYAQCPDELVVPAVLAGCPSGGIILDTFSGTRRTAIVARRYNRNSIGIEINPKSTRIGDRLMLKEFGLFHNVLCTA